MIEPRFNKHHTETRLLQDALNKDEYLNELKQIRNHMRSIMNSWRDAEHEDEKDYACYYVYEKNLCGDLDDFIKAMERD